MQIASAEITLAYLSDFRLLWRAQLARVGAACLDLADKAPGAVVDAFRCAQLLDATISVRFLGPLCPFEPCTHHY
jgi:hypothetical protein